jgi:hypothetical protein
MFDLVPAAQHSRTCAIFASTHDARSRTEPGKPSPFRPVPCDCGRE